MHPRPEGYNAVWRFEGDARTRQYTLTIEYASDLPPAEHERMHARLYREACDWLLGQGVPADGASIVINGVTATASRCDHATEEQAEHLAHDSDRDADTEGGEDAHGMRRKDAHRESS